MVFPVGWGESSTRPFNSSTVEYNTVMVSFELGFIKGGIGFAKVRNFICGSCIEGPTTPQPTLPPPDCPQNDPGMPEPHDWVLTEIGCIRYLMCITFEEVNFKRQI